MSILGPLLVAGFYAIIIWSAVTANGPQQIAIYDEEGLLYKAFGNTTSQGHYFRINQEEFQQQKQGMGELYYDAILHVVSKRQEAGLPIVRLYCGSKLNNQVLAHIQEEVNKSIRRIKLKRAGLSEREVEGLEEDYTMMVIDLTKEGNAASEDELVSVVGFLGGLVVYLFIFMYSVQVMKGVMEEKQNRIIEVMICSVRPLELMMGKVLGIAAVGLTQIGIWIVLITSLSLGVTLFLGIDPSEVTTSSAVVAGTVAGTEWSQLIQSIAQIDFMLLGGCFIFYFLIGYLSYAALFAAIGAAVDADTDTQQFLLPVSMPLVLSIALSGSIMVAPEGDLAVWLSMIPLTSPVAMMIRVPMLGYDWQILVSMALLLIFFFGVTVIASKIYRIGILVHGKKISYQELLKWLRA
ncbi:ABC transporter permease [Algivirga pacifica]|uniref:ABC transporter permease n=2 Tax=Algivirga pacifica TaxID=1162670 RepID=A0ABP9DGQ4_9BACT